MTAIKQYRSIGIGEDAERLEISYTAGRRIKWLSSSEGETVQPSKRSDNVSHKNLYTNAQTVFLKEVLTTHSTSWPQTCNSLASPLPKSGIADVPHTPSTTSALSFLIFVLIYSHVHTLSALFLILKSRSNSNVPQLMFG
jgi:hypothetical protein